MTVGKVQRLSVGRIGGDGVRQELGPLGVARIFDRGLR